MQYNMTVRKKDGNYQIIVSYKNGIKWKQKSKQGFATQREAKLYGQQIVDNLKKTITSPLDDSLKDITLNTPIHYGLSIISQLLLYLQLILLAVNITSHILPHFTIRI